MRPNILVFMSDQEQGDVVHPDHPCRTPNATRLAREGLRFRRSFCPTAHCCPSRATFMTGLYPSRHGIYNNVSNPTAIHKALNEGVGTFSEALRRAGYNLAYAGKWHVTDEENPSDRGWEELFVTSGKGSFHHRSIEQWREQASRPEADGPRGRGQILRPGWGNYQLYRSHPTDTPKGYEGHSDHRVVTSALEALPRLAREPAPWFLFIGPSGPHDPFIVPERYVHLYDPAEIPLPPSFHDTLEDKPRVYQRMRRQYWGQLSEEEVRESIQHYWAYCTMEDALFGEVLDALEATGQAGNTLVLRLSDHGDYCGAHGLYLKGVPAFREAYHIVTIARWPAGITSPGREVEEFVTLADFAPTYNEAGGRLAGETMAEALGTAGKVAILEGIRGADNAEARKRGFEAGVSGKLEVAARDSAEWDTQKAYAKFQSMLAAHRDLDGVFCANDKMALGAMKAIQEAGRKKITVIGYDNIPDVRPYLKSGAMYATIEQHPDLMGRYGVKMAVGVLEGTVTKGREYLVPLEVVKGR